MSNFDSSPSSEVTIEMELFFQLQCLVTGIGLPASFSFCKYNEKNSKDRHSGFISIDYLNSKISLSFFEPF